MTKFGPTAAAQKSRHLRVSCLANPPERST